MLRKTSIDAPVALHLIIREIDFYTGNARSLLYYYVRELGMKNVELAKNKFRSTQVSQAVSIGKKIPEKQGLSLMSK